MIFIKIRLFLFIWTKIFLRTRKKNTRHELELFNSKVYFMKFFAKKVRMFINDLATLVEVFSTLSMVRVALYACESNEDKRKGRVYIFKYH